MKKTAITLNNALDDLCIRFLFNIHEGDLESFERLFFQVEEAHWFYLDFFVAKNPTLPKLTLRDFAARILAHHPLLHSFVQHVDTICNTFEAYKHQVPVNGAIILNEDFSKVLLVKGVKASCWGFPRGKLSFHESDVECAIREVKEEIGFDITPYIKPSEFISLTIRQQPCKLFIVCGVPTSTMFKTVTRNEIGEIKWHSLESMPHTNPRNSPSARKSNKYFRILPFLRELSKWLQHHKKRTSTYSPEALTLVAPCVAPHQSAFRPIQPITETPVFGLAAPLFTPSSQTTSSTSADFSFNFADLMSAF